MANLIDLSLSPTPNSFCVHSYAFFKFWIWDTIDCGTKHRTNVDIYEYHILF